MNTSELEPRERLTIEFLTPDSSDSGVAVVSLPEFIEVLEGFQQSVFAVGAHNLGRRQLLGSARQAYTLAVVAYRYSSLHIDFQTIQQLAQLQQQILPGIAEGIASSAA